MIIAVLASDKLYRYDMSKRYNDDEMALSILPMAKESIPHSTVQLLGLCLRHAIETLWIMPDCETSDFALLNPKAFTDPVDGWETIVPQRTNGAIMSIKAYRRGDKTRRIVFAVHSYRWGMGEVDNPMELLHALIKAHSSLGIPVELSPGATGRSLIKATCNPDWIQDADISDLPRSIAVPLHMKRAFTSDEREKKYLHVYDKNAMYLRGCMGVELGVGSPVHIGDDMAHSLFKERQTGLWYASLLPPDGEGMLPWKWYWTPEVHSAMRRGYLAKFKEAWIWHVHKPILELWASKLWSALVEFQHDTFVKKMIKTIYTQGLGWLAMREERKRDTHDTLYRPDWDAMVISHSRMVLEMLLLKLKKQGYDCVWVNNDEVGFLSDNPDPIQAVPGLVLNDTLAGFKLKYAGGIPVTKQLVDVFEDDATWGETQKTLLALGKEAKVRHTEKLQKAMLRGAVDDMIAEVRGNGK